MKSTTVLNSSSLFTEKPLFQEIKPVKIKTVMAFAVKHFVGGRINNQVVSEAGSEAELKKRFHYESDGILRAKDTDFPSYNACRISGSSFIAAKGPQNALQVDDLLVNTIFNTKQPVEQIVILIDRLGDSKTTDGTGCEDYFLNPKKFDRANVMSIKQYESGPIIKYKIGAKICCIDENSQLAHPIIRSDLTVSHYVKGLEEEKILKVVVIGVLDGWPIDLNVENGNKLKDLFWRLAEKSREKNILVHCAAGIGRTGHLIFTLELLKNYEKIFISQNPAIISDEIFKVLNRIRVNCPALVLSAYQFTYAIENAHHTYQYALKKGYVKKVEAKKEKVSEFKEVKL